MLPQAGWLSPGGFLQDCTLPASGKTNSSLRVSMGIDDDMRIVSLILIIWDLIGIYGGELDFMMIN